MLPLVCYSHTDYSDVLAVQCDALRGLVCPLYLCFNTPDGPAPFQRTLVYDETLQYSKRLEQSLRQIDEPYICLFQDMDILVHVDLSTLAEVVDAMMTNGVDRVDLKCAGGDVQIQVREDIGLIRNTDPRGYVYNVNPSIWRREALLELLAAFDRTYRTIEGDDVQAFCTRFRVCQLILPDSVATAYFRVAPWFVYLHITSAGKLIPETENGLCPDLQATYTRILETYSFHRGMKTRLYGYD